MTGAKHAKAATNRAPSARSAGRVRVPFDVPPQFCEPMMLKKFWRFFEAVGAVLGHALRVVDLAC
jgi:hypothetical protein